VRTDARKAVPELRPVLMPEITKSAGTPDESLAWLRNGRPKARPPAADSVALIQAMREESQDESA